MDTKDGMFCLIPSLLRQTYLNSNRRVGAKSPMHGLKFMIFFVIPQTFIVKARDSSCLKMYYIMNYTATSSSTIYE